MRPESVAWERTAEVREAAQGWLRVGAIDKRTEHAIRTAFPDPRITPSVVWRMLTACISTAVILCAFAAFSIGAWQGGVALQVLLIVFAGASLIATELQDASPRFAARGGVGATSFWGIVFFLGGFGLFLQDTLSIKFDSVLDLVLIASFLAWGGGCWRWGIPLFAALSSVSLFLYLGRPPQGRILWIIVGAALAAVAGRLLDEASWAPSQRRAAAVLVVVGISAVYAGANTYSLDEHVLENLRWSGTAPVGTPSALFVLSALATAVVPLLVLAWGIGSRRTFLLDAGIILLALSLVTLRHYVYLAPLWTILTASGTALVVVTLAVERALRRAPKEEIGGFTAESLFSDERRQQALQVIPVVAAFTPAAPDPAVEKKDFVGGSGKFGGGGAQGDF
jgi:hypothetical protein